MDSTAWTVGAAPDEERLAGDRGSAIEIAQPERNVLLGSASRGEIVDDRALESLVVANPRHGRAVARGDQGAAATERPCTTYACIIHDALRDGPVLRSVADAPPLDPE